MIDFFINLGESIKGFFHTPVATLLGVMFIIFIVASVIFIQKTGEK